jgi:hypothetical protein
MAPQAQHKPTYTKEKASHLIRVYCAILSVFFLIGWMQLTLLRPLKDEKKEMVRTTRDVFRGGSCDVDCSLIHSFIPLLQ